MAQHTHSLKHRPLLRATGSYQTTDSCCRSTVAASGPAGGWDQSRRVPNAQHLPHPIQHALMEAHSILTPEQFHPTVPVRPWRGAGTSLEALLLLPVQNQPNHVPASVLGGWTHHFVRARLQIFFALDSTTYPLPLSHMTLGPCLSLRGI